MLRGRSYTFTRRGTYIDSTKMLIFVKAQGGKYHRRDSAAVWYRLFSPSDISKKLSHHFLLHFPIGMGFYDHHAKYQGVFP